MLIAPSKVKKEANRLLEIWDDLCTEYEVPHFLIYGTALGFYRDHGFIKTDNDIDTRMFCDLETGKEIKQRFKEEAKVHGNHPTGASFIRAVKYEEETRHLLFCIEVSPEIGIIVHDNGKTRKVPAYYNELDTVEYNGRTYNVPSPIEEYLQIRYGPNWKIPNPDWNKRLGEPYRLTLDEPYLSN